VPDLKRALEQTLDAASATDVIVVTGSTYLVGEARALLCGERQDPLPLADPAAI
jgi:folylpolyglutamate synthase/dihydropteroate synthase